MFQGYTAQVRLIGRWLICRGRTSDSNHPLNFFIFITNQKPYRTNFIIAIISFLNLYVVYNLCIKYVIKWKKKCYSINFITSIYDDLIIKTIRTKIIFLCYKIFLNRKYFQLYVWVYRGFPRVINSLLLLINYTMARYSVWFIVLPKMSCGISLILLFDPAFLSYTHLFTISSLVYE